MSNIENARFEFSEDSQFSFGIHDVTQTPPARIGEAYEEGHARLLAAAPEMLAALREIESLARGISRRADARRIVCEAGRLIRMAEGRV